MAAPGRLRPARRRLMTAHRHLLARPVRNGRTAVHCGCDTPAHGARRPRGARGLRKLAVRRPHRAAAPPARPAGGNPQRPRGTGQPPPGAAGHRRAREEPAAQGTVVALPASATAWMVRAIGCSGCATGSAAGEDVRRVPAARPARFAGPGGAPAAPYDRPAGRPGLLTQPAPTDPDRDRDPESGRHKSADGSGTRDPCNWCEQGFDADDCA